MKINSRQIVRQQLSVAGVLLSAVFAAGAQTAPPSPAADTPAAAQAAAAASTVQSAGAKRAGVLRVGILMPKDELGAQGNLRRVSRFERLNSSSCRVQRLRW